MTRRIRHILTAFAMGVLLCAATPHAAMAQELSAAQKSYSSAARQRSQLVNKLEDLESRYAGLVRRIEELKRSGAMDTFAGRLELGNLLRESKSIADELGQLQEDVRRIDARLDRERDSVLARIDEQVVSLERKLGRASRDERRELVRQLNALRRQRSNYSAPLPEAPSLGQVRDTLSLAEEVDSSQPEEMLAAADELQDTEDQVTRRLDAIRGRLETLNRRKRLMRRADNFSREEQFFEEKDRNRVIARVDRGSSNDGSGSADDEAGQDAPNEEADSPVLSGDDLASGNNGSPAPTSGGMEPDESADFESGGRQSGGPEPTDVPGSPESAPESGGDDPFSGSSGTVVIGAGAEPTRAVGSDARRVRDVDAAIGELEEEEEKLSRQARELKKRASELRRKARQLQ